MNKTTCSTVVGIDVGGFRKGFHAVALRQDLTLKTFKSPSARKVTDWCVGMDATLVGVDAPCRWSRDGRARPAERELAAAGIFSFATPREKVAQAKPFYQWMLNGLDLYQCLWGHFPLFDGRLPAKTTKASFETFPQAVACSLAGKVVSAKKKGSVRRQLLKHEILDISELTNIDYVDAALCALAARYLLEGEYSLFGDTFEGFIVVPKTMHQKPLLAI